MWRGVMKKYVGLNKPFNVRLTDKWAQESVTGD